MRIVALLALLAGCTFAPLDYEENIPQVGTGSVTPEQEVWGSLTVNYLRSSDQQVICGHTYEVYGWVAEEQSSEDVGCVGCAEVFELGLLPDQVDPDCDWRPSGTPTVAFVPLSFFPVSSDPEFYDWLNSVEGNVGAGDPVAFVRTNWTPIGPTSWDNRGALFSIPGDSDWGRELEIRPRFSYWTSGQESLASFSFELQFLE